MNNNDKFQVLKEKELILNKTDTANILKAVDIVKMNNELMQYQVDFDLLEEKYSIRFSTLDLANYFLNVIREHTKKLSLRKIDNEYDSTNELTISDVDRDLYRKIREVSRKMDETLNDGDISTYCKLNDVYNKLLHTCGLSPLQRRTSNDISK